MAASKGNGETQHVPESPKASRSRSAYLIGGLAVLLAAGAGVLWGVVDARSLAANGDTTTAVAMTTFSTTTAPLVTTTGQPSTNTMGESSPATTTTRATSGGESSPSPNQAPVIEDPGISSAGMTLTVAPVVSDPEGDVLGLTVGVGGATEIGPADEFEVSTTFDVDEVGYTHTATITIQASDSAGNEVTETFTHEVTAITTVTVRDFLFQIRADACFERYPAVRFEGQLVLSGSVDGSSSFSAELRSDQRSVEFVGGEFSDDTVGVPPGVVGLELEAALTPAAPTEAHTDTHSGSDIVLINMFGAPCTGMLTYRVDVSTR